MLPELKGFSSTLIDSMRDFLDRLFWDPIIVPVYYPSETSTRKIVICCAYINISLLRVLHSILNYFSLNNSNKSRGAFEIHIFSQSWELSLSSSLTTKDQQRDPSHIIKWFEWTRLCDWLIKIPKRWCCWITIASSLSFASCLTVNLQQQSGILTTFPRPARSALHPQEIPKVSVCLSALACR